MSRSRRILHGFGIGLLNQALIAVLGLWLTRFILHRVGEHDYGSWIVAGQLIGYLSLVDLGVTALLPREVASITGNGDSAPARDGQLQIAIGRAISLVLVTLPPLALASLLFLGLLPADLTPLRGPLAVAVGALVLCYPLQIPRAVLEGLQDFAFLGWVDSLSSAMTAGVTVVLALLDFRLYAVALGPVVGQLVASAAWIFRLCLRHQSVIPSRIPAPRIMANGAHIVTGLSLSLSRIAHILLNNTDIVVIGRIRGPTAVLKYTFTDKTETLANNQPYMFANLAGPALAEVRASKDPRRFATAVGALSGVIVVFSGALVVALIATNHAFVRAWIGEEHFGGLGLTALLLANMTARHLQFGFGIAIFYAGRVRENTILCLLDGVLSVILTIVLVRYIGIAGAPLASLLSVLLAQTPYALVLLGRETGESIRKTLSPVGSWFIRFVPFAAAAWLAAAWFGPASVVKSVFAGSVLTAGYGWTMVSLLRRPPLDSYAAPYFSKMEALRKRVFATTKRA